MGFVEAMDLIDEQQRLAAAGGQAIARLPEYLAQFLHAVRHGTQLPKLTAAFPRQQAGQRRLASAWRTEEDHGSQAVGLQQAAEQLAFAQKLLLAHELLERPRAHAGRRVVEPAGNGPLPHLQTETCSQVVTSGPFYSEQVPLPVGRPGRPEQGDVQVRQGTTVQPLLVGKESK